MPSVAAATAQCRRALHCAEGGLCRAPDRIWCRLICFDVLYYLIFDILIFQVTVCLRIFYTKLHPRRRRAMPSRPILCRRRALPRSRSYICASFDVLFCFLQVTICPRSSDIISYRTLFPIGTKCGKDPKTKKPKRPSISALPRPFRLLVFI